MVSLSFSFYNLEKESEGGKRETMTRKEIIQLIEENKIVAIMRKVPMDALEETVAALYRGGIRMMEVTFDPAGDMPTEDTLKQIQYIAENYSDVAPGAGTVLTVEQVQKAKEAGAKYIISPNVSEKVIKETVASGMVSMPGAFTPTEAVNAVEYGADFVKIFPVRNMGTKYIKDIAAPLSHIRFIAVGGIDDKNLKSYLDAGCKGVGVAAALVNQKLIQERRFDELEALAVRHVAAINEA